ncbi:hypothetical protein [Heliomicrobium modesticaldum]|uniref:hypothetical protein n=1 Tax=Heliomicrobium modesticaldum TaxID=35701 RepID=UPI0002D25A7E|nr:hypothetical protein [Heliomicrobium modesticaldum]
MERDRIVALIMDVLADVVEDEALPEGFPPKTDWNEQIKIFGRDGLLDSVGLVTLIVDVEQQVEEQTGRSIVLADERAMSQKQSPFQTIGTLADYVMTLF